MKEQYKLFNEAFNFLIYQNNEDKINYYGDNLGNQCQALYNFCVRNLTVESFIQLYESVKEKLPDDMYLSKDAFIELRDILDLSNDKNVETHIKTLTENTHSDEYFISKENIQNLIKELVELDIQFRAEQTQKEIQQEIKTKEDVKTKFNLLFGENSEDSIYYNTAIDKNNLLNMVLNASKQFKLSFINFYEKIKDSIPENHQLTDKLLLDVFNAFKNISDSSQLMSFEQLSDQFNKAPKTISKEQIKQYCVDKKEQFETFFNSLIVSDYHDMSVVERLKKEPYFINTLLNNYSLIKGKVDLCDEPVFFSNEWLKTIDGLVATMNGIADVEGPKNFAVSFLTPRYHPYLTSYGTIESDKYRNNIMKLCSNQFKQSDYFMVDKQGKRYYKEVWPLEIFNIGFSAALDERNFSGCEYFYKFAQKFTDNNLEIPKLLIYAEREKFNLLEQLERLPPADFVIAEKTLNSIRRRDGSLFRNLNDFKNSMLYLSESDDPIKKLSLSIVARSSNETQDMINRVLIKSGVTEKQMTQIKTALFESKNYFNDGWAKLENKIQQYCENDCSNYLKLIKKRPYMLDEMNQFFDELIHKHSNEKFKLPELTENDVRMINDPLEGKSFKEIKENILTSFKVTLEKPIDLDQKISERKDSDRSEELEELEGHDGFLNKLFKRFKNRSDDKENNEEERLENEKSNKPNRIILQ